MFILERLFGVGVYSLVLVIVCSSLVGKSLDKQRRILSFYIIILSVMAFFYKPYETTDLYRIYEYVEAFEGYPFQKFLEVHVKNKSAGLAYLYYWLVAQSGIPRLLPLINTFVCYSCIFYIIEKTAEKKNISGKNVAITLFFYMTTETYMSIIAGIRCMLGVSLLAFCFFRETVEKKFSIFHLPLYVISFFVHTFSAVLIMARLFIPIFKDKKVTVKKCLYTISLILGIRIAFIYLGSYFDAVFSKADGFISGDNYTYMWGYVIDVVVWFVLVSVVFTYTQKVNTGKISNFKSIKFFLSVCLAISISASSSSLRLLSASALKPRISCLLSVTTTR